jgi:hypothetical protein
MLSVTLFCLLIQTFAFSLPASKATSYQDMGDTSFNRYKLNTLLGVNIVHGSAIVSGMQLGYAPKTAVPLYLGAEFNFSLFSPGSLFSVLIGGWHEFKIRGAPKLSLSLGAVIGPGFTNQLPYLPITPLVGLLDIAISQEIDDFMSVRGQFRPGIVGRYLAFMMNFNVSFRFP